jgi:hypothetical protein
MMNGELDPRVIREQQLMLIDLVHEYPEGLLYRSEMRRNKGRWNPRYLIANPSITDDLVASTPQLDWEIKILVSDKLSPELRLSTLNSSHIDELMNLKRGDWKLSSTYLDGPISERIIELFDKVHDNPELISRNTDEHIIFSIARDLSEYSNINIEGAKLFLNSKYSRHFAWDTITYRGSDCCVWIIEQMLKPAHNWMLEYVDDNGNNSIWWNAVLSIPASEVDALTHIAELIYDGSIVNLSSNLFCWLLVYLPDPVAKLMELTRELGFRISPKSLLLIKNRCHSPIVNHYLLDIYPDPNSHVVFDVDGGDSDLWKEAIIDDDLALRLLNDRDWIDYWGDIVNNVRVSDEVKIEFIDRISNDRLTEFRPSTNSRINRHVIQKLGSMGVLNMLLDLVNDSDLDDLNCDWAYKSMEIIRVHDLESLERLSEYIGRIKIVNPRLSSLYNPKYVKIKYNGPINSDFLKLMYEGKILANIQWKGVTKRADYLTILNNPDLPWSEIVLNTRTYEPVRKFNNTKRAITNRN